MSFFFFFFPVGRLKGSKEIQLGGYFNYPQEKWCVNWITGSDMKEKSGKTESEEVEAIRLLPFSTNIYWTPTINQILLDSGTKTLSSFSH